MSGRRCDVLVIGAGVAGLGAAYHLVRNGARTLLLDRADAGQATAAGAGILSTPTYSGESAAWYQLGRGAGAHYQTLIPQLLAAGVGDTGYAICGKLTVAVSPDETAPYDRALERVRRRQQQYGLPERQDLFEVDPDQARQRFPPLAATRRALYYARAARIDGRLLAAALQQAAVEAGLEVKKKGVERLELSGATVVGAVAEGVLYQAGHTIIAGGAWSPPLAAALDLRLEVVPQRGQIIHLRLPDTDTSAWPIISAFHDHYLVPWPEGRVVVGATRESDAGFAAHTTAAGMRQVLDEALRVAPGLAQAEIGEIRVGLRPYTADGLPVLGPAPGWSGLLLSTGFGATGLQLAPYCGLLMADLVAGRTPPTDIAPFLIDRFQP